MSYVNEQNLAVRTSELTPRQMLHATLLYLIAWTSARPSNQMHPLPGHFTSNQRNSGQVDISAPSNRTITNHKSTSVNPNATPFVPRTLASRLVNEPTQGQDENRGTTSELIQFLLKLKKKGFAHVEILKFKWPSWNLSSLENFLQSYHIRVKCM